MSAASNHANPTLTEIIFYPIMVDACVVGVDYGTLSGRAVVVRVADGMELGSAVYEYPHAVIDRTLPVTGSALPPDWALQDPEDYRGVLCHAVPAALAAAHVPGSG